jgi:hypothetical protein
VSASIIPIEPAVAAYMKAYRQRPEVKERERARKRTPEYKARKAEYMRDYQAWNRFRLSGYEQARQAAVRERKLIAEGKFGEPIRYCRVSLFGCGKCEACLALAGGVAR